MPMTPKELLAGKPSLGAGTGLIGKPGVDKRIGLTAPRPKAMASLPLARASASWRKSRVKKRSCWTNLPRNSSPLSSHINDQIDWPELGTRGSLKPICPSIWDSSNRRRTLVLRPWPSSCCTKCYESPHRREKNIKIYCVLTLSSQIWPPHHCLGSFTSGSIQNDSIGSSMPSWVSPAAVPVPQMIASK